MSTQNTPIRVIVPGKNPNGTDDSEYTVNVKPVNAAAKAARFNNMAAAAAAQVAAAPRNESEVAIEQLLQGTPAKGGKRKRSHRKRTRRNKRKGTRRNKRN